MESFWTITAIIALCAIIIAVYFIRRNLKDKKEVEKFFNEEIRHKKDIELSDEDEV